VLAVVLLATNPGTLLRAGMEGCQELSFDTLDGDEIEILAGKMRSLTRREQR
jgi:hypothetical protein